MTVFTCLLFCLRCTVRKVDNGEGVVEGSEGIRLKFGNLKMVSLLNGSASWHRTL